MDINQRIGDYEILGELGQGGMGRVYRVRNVIADRVEAMKVLLPDLAGRPDLAARFLREIKMLAALNHPNIAALRTALTAGNQLVMIMEYVEGQSLAERLAHSPIATADAMAYIDQVLDALAYAHGRGVIHRDIKPANMMLTPAGVVKLTDFGIARSATDETITVAGTTTGSLSYMAPEQVNGETTDARSDLYSVGISLYEMVTGQRSFRADSDFHVMLAHLKQEPRPPIELQPSLPAALNGIILRCIAKDPAERVQSSEELRQALRSVPATGRGATTSRDTAVRLSAAAPVIAIGDAAAPEADRAQPGPEPLSDRTRTALATRTSFAPPSAAPPPSSAPSESSAPSASSVTSAPSAAVPRTEAAAIHAVQPPPMRSGHPLLFVALGAVLVITALVGTGLYLGRAEAGPERSGGAAPAATATPAPGATEADVTATDATAADAATPEAGAPRPSAATPEGLTAPSEAAAATEWPTARGGAATLPTAPAAPAESAPAAGAPADAPPPAGAQPARAPAAQAPRTNVAQPAPPARSGGTPPAATRPAGSASAVESSAPPQPPAAPVAPATPAAPAPASSAELDALESDIDGLVVRAGAINSSLDRLQQEQARQGLGLRGDMAARQESMRINLSRAQDALDREDLPRARKSHDAARSDVEALERFLGR